MPDLAEFGNSLDSLDGELFSPGSPGFEEIRRPVNPACREIRPRLVVACRSVSDVVGTIRYATATGDRMVPRGGGHCFAGRSLTDGIVLDMSGLNGICVAADGAATIGAGARLGQVYAALHTRLRAGLRHPRGGRRLRRLARRQSPLKDHACWLDGAPAEILFWAIRE